MQVSTDIKHLIDVAHENKYLQKGTFTAGRLSYKDGERSYVLNVYFLERTYVADDDRFSHESLC